MKEFIPLCGRCFIETNLQCATPVSEGRCRACSGAADVLVEQPSHPVLGQLSRFPTAKVVRIAEPNSPDGLWGKPVTTDNLPDIILAFLDVVERVEGSDNVRRIQLWEDKQGLLLYVAVNSHHLTGYINDAVKLGAAPSAAERSCG